MCYEIKIWLWQPSSLPHRSKEGEKNRVSGILKQGRSSTALTSSGYRRACICTTIVIGLWSTVYWATLLP